MCSNAVSGRNNNLGWEELGYVTFGATGLGASILI